MTCIGGYVLSHDIIVHIIIVTVRDTGGNIEYIPDYHDGRMINAKSTSGIMEITYRWDTVPVPVAIGIGWQFSLRFHDIISNFGYLILHPGGMGGQQ